MRRKKLKITEMDYLKANRRASRQEEIESHGHPVQGRAMIHKSKKVYDRNRMKRAAIKSDDSSHFFYVPQSFIIYCYAVGQFRINCLIESDLTTSKGLCKTCSNDVVLTEISSSIVNTSGSLEKRSATASDVEIPDPV